MTLVKDLRSLFGRKVQADSVDTNRRVSWLLCPQRRRPNGEGLRQEKRTFGESTGRPVESRDSLLFKTTDSAPHQMRYSLGSLLYILYVPLGFLALFILTA